MSELVSKDINVNINVNLNIKVNLELNNNNNDINNWADISEDDLINNLFQEIKEDKENKRIKRKNTIKHITSILDNINVSFEPDPSYRNNVRYIVIGLVLSQMLKQKTINLYRKGKEDREYLASYLMMVIQSYLIKNHSIDEWGNIIISLFDYYKDNITRNEEMNKLIKKGLNYDKYITQDILIATILSNKKNYTLRTNKQPISYE